MPLLILVGSLDLLAKIRPGLYREQNTYAMTIKIESCEQPGQEWTEHEMHGSLHRG